MESLSVFFKAYLVFETILLVSGSFHEPPYPSTYASSLAQAPVGMYSRLNAYGESESAASLGNAPVGLYHKQQRQNPYPAFLQYGSPWLYGAPLSYQPPVYQFPQYGFPGFPILDPRQRPPRPPRPVPRPAPVRPPPARPPPARPPPVVRPKPTRRPRVSPRLLGPLGGLAQIPALGGGLGQLLGLG